MGCMDAHSMTVEQGRRSLALQGLRRNVRRLCEVRYAAEPEVAQKAWAFYASLPPADGDDFRDFLIEEIQIYAGQFGPCGTVAKRPAVTEAFAALLDD